MIAIKRKIDLGGCQELRRNGFQGVGFQAEIFHNHRLQIQMELAHQLWIDNREVPFTLPAYFGVEAANPIVEGNDPVPFTEHGAQPKLVQPALQHGEIESY